MKPGVRTSEFWMTLVASTAGLVGTYAGIDPETLIAAVGPLAAYVVSRGWAKSGTTDGP